MPNMTAIKPAAFREPDRRSCMACSTAVSAAIRCWSSTNTTPSTYATRCVRNMVSPFVRTSPATRLIKRSSRPSLRRSHPSNSMSMREPWRLIKKASIKLAAEGISDEEIARRLTESGHRSPMRQHVLPSTVRTIRLKHGIMIKRHQSHPRRIDGYLTVTQLAKELGVSVHFIYDRIHNGTIEIAKDEATGLYLFPDRPTTIKQFRKLIDGRLQTLDF